MVLVPDLPTASPLAPVHRAMIDRAAILLALRAVPGDKSSSGGSSPAAYDGNGHDGLTDMSIDSDQ
jgi:hypothetical protein